MIPVEYDWLSIIHDLLLASKRRELHPIWAHLDLAILILHEHLILLHHLLLYLLLNLLRIASGCLILEHQALILKIELRIKLRLHRREILVLRELRRATWLSLVGKAYDALHLAS